MSKAFLTAACLLALSMPASAAAPKDYYFPEVRVDISIASDGTFLVDEYRAFEFEGSFSYAYIVIPLRVESSGLRREVSVSDLAVTDEQGQALRTELGQEGGRLTAKWFYSARDERRTFHIHYRVGLQSVISSIEHTATAIHQASASAAHYSSGGGGGFSGGGGGGGSGGGGGAG